MKTRTSTPVDLSTRKSGQIRWKYRLFLLSKPNKPARGRFLFNAGPYVGYGLSGTADGKITDKQGNIFYSVTSKYGALDPHILHWYAGGIASAGYELNSGLFGRLFFQRDLYGNIGSYSYGLTAGYIISKKQNKPVEPGKTN